MSIAANVSAFDGSGVKRAAICHWHGGTGCAGAPRSGHRSARLVIGGAGRSEIDVRQLDLLENSLAVFSPDIVINPAAYTAVDRAEFERELAFAVNRDGAGHVATAAARIGIPVVHLSTDYVFDGTKGAPYVETDPVTPMGVYGQSKLAGECAVAAANEHHIILRTSWVYAPYGNNFVRTMLRLFAERDRLRVVDDQIGCPTYASDIAAAIIRSRAKSNFRLA